jgi:hypothetical protein
MSDHPAVFYLLATSFTSCRHLVLASTPLSLTKKKGVDPATKSRDDG